MQRFCKIILTVLAVLAAVPSFAAPRTLENKSIRVSVSDEGNILSLRNLATGTEYASGGYLWRMYYDTPERKEIEVIGGLQTPSAVEQSDSTIVLRYDRLLVEGREVAMSVVLTVSLEEDMVRFASSLRNEEAHSVIRELHYPLLHGAQLPADHQLYTSEAGGKLFPDPLATINKLADSPYKKPEQVFRQRDVKYGAKVFMNCFGLFGKDQGLYFGSHDGTFQDTWHGLRAYRNPETGKFDVLEFGFFKYPHCFCGETWACDANVIAPYSGTWHVASGLYRRWADTWWDHRATPQWVQELRSWQRVIFQHQYGE